MPAAKVGGFVVPLDWKPVAPVELSAQDELVRTRTSARRRMSASLGDRGRFADGSWYVLSDGDRHLFDAHAQREKRLGKILLEVKPCGAYEDVAGCGCISIGAQMCLSYGERPVEHYP